MGAAIDENHTRESATPASVLVVDDESPVRKAIARALGSQGFGVVEAADGVAALRAAADVRPQLAIVDRYMPGMDGLAVVRHLKSSLGPDIHALVLSGMHEQERRIEAFDAGADDFVAKPFSMDELVERLRAAQRIMLELAELRRAREREERLRVYAAEASALLAHDLNNGLAIALGNLDFVNQSSALDEEEQDAVRSSIRALKRMAGLVSNFTDIGRMEDGAMTPIPSDCAVLEFLHNVAAIHAPSCSDIHHIHIDCEPDLRARFDLSLIERVLHNLIGNSTRYVDERGLVRVRAYQESTRDEPEAPWLAIEVANTGPAIPPGVQKKIFEKYGVGGDQQSVRGMGLYFCRLACEAHGGTIAVRSTPDLTAFTFRLPME